jgi:hypothetical protein
LGGGRGGAAGSGGIGGGTGVKRSRPPPQPLLFAGQEGEVDSDDERATKLFAEQEAERNLPAGLFTQPRRRTAGASAPAPVPEPQPPPPPPLPPRSMAAPPVASAAAAAGCASSARRYWVEGCKRRGDVGPGQLNPCGFGCLLWYHHLCITAPPVCHEGNGCGSPDCGRCP